MVTKSVGTVNLSKERIARVREEFLNGVRFEKEDEKNRLIENARLSGAELLKIAHSVKKWDYIPAPAKKLSADNWGHYSGEVELIPKTKVTIVVRSPNGGMSATVDKVFLGRSTQESFLANLEKQRKKVEDKLVKEMRLKLRATKGTVADTQELKLLRTIKSSL